MTKPRIEKLCSRCRRSLPLDAFHMRRHYMRSGRRSACTECTREANLARGYTPPDPHKAAVRRRTHAAIEKGVLTALPCRVCDSPDVQAHHPHYDQPDSHLVVAWLCRKHHALEHGVRPWTRQLELNFASRSRSA